MADFLSAYSIQRWLESCPQGYPGGVTLTLPRKVVADLLGMRAETLSRAMTELGELNAIAVTRTTVRIIDDVALRHVAHIV